MPTSPRSKFHPIRNKFQQIRNSRRNPLRLVSASLKSPCHCEPDTSPTTHVIARRALPAVAISCGLVAVSIEPPCHCEPSFARRGNLLSVGSCVFRTPMSLPLGPFLRRKRYPLGKLWVQFLRRVSFLFRQERYQRSRLGRV